MYVTQVYHIVTCLITCLNWLKTHLVIWSIQRSVILLHVRLVSYNALMGLLGPGGLMVKAPDL